MGVTAGGAGKQKDTSAESDWGGGGWGGGGRVVWQPSTAAGQQKGWGGGTESSKLRIFSLSLSLLPSLLQVRFK
jgi:hypothetical protein